MSAFIDQNRNSDIYKQAGAFDDEDIVTEAKESLKSAKENIVLAEKLEKERELERIRAREKELDAKRDAKTKAEKLMENSTQAEAIKKEILAIFDKTKMNSGLKKLACDAVYKSSVDSVKAIWNAVDGKSGDDLETALKSGMEDMFIGTHTFIFPFFDQQNGLVEAQKITDMMLKQFSPIAFDEKLAKYGDSYFINHTSVETIGRLAKIDDFEVARSLLIDAKDALKNDRVNLDLSADFVEKDNGEKKSPKIEEPTAPTLGTNVRP
jgi:DNA-binding protein H-NS